MAQLLEHQSKRILAENDVMIPAGELARTSAAARAIAENLNKPVVVKAQIQNTSRATLGAVRFADTPDEAEEIARELLGKEIGGSIVEAVLVDEKLDIELEFYLGFIIDDRLKRPTLLFSDVGGSGIEERAATLRKLVCSIRREPTIEEIKTIVQSPNFSLPSAGEARRKHAEAWTLNEDQLGQIAEILLKLYRTAKSCEARIAEINPLALLKDGRLVALDARISVDDYAVFRHEDLKIEMARELGHTPTRLERIAWEIERDDFRGTFYFVEILNSSRWSEVGGQEKESGQWLVVSGRNKDKTKNDYQGTAEIQNLKTDHRPLTTDHFLIGFHGAGGGGSMASLDAAQRNGLSPACYVDTSGNPPASKVYRAAKIILSIPNIKGYFLSGSGVASQEQFGLARAVIKAFREVRPNIPAVLRLGGNGEDYAKELVEKFTADLPFPVEAYQKNHSADFCAARLGELIESSRWSVVGGQEKKSGQWSVVSGQNKDKTKKDYQGTAEIQNQETDHQPPTTDHYSFKTRTGEIIFDHSVFAEADAAPLVEACPVKILKLDEHRLPVLAITREEAERGKCIECLACEFASWEYKTGGVEINLPIIGL